MKSIRSRFILIYFALVFISLLVGGVFIIKGLENSQLELIKDQMQNTAYSITTYSDIFQKSNWKEESAKLGRVLDEFKVNSNQLIYVIEDEDDPRIVETVNVNTNIGENNYALSYSGLNPDLIIDAFSGIESTKTVADLNGKLSQMHLVYPVFTSDGDVNGVFYIISNLDVVNDLITKTQRILLNASALALITSIILGFIMSRSITGPIIDLKNKIRNVASGDYTQRVEVKSKDEIGSLATMFNNLTVDLQNTVSSMELERAKLNTIFEFMQEGVIAIDRNGKLIHANKEAAELLKLNTRDIGNNDINLNNLKIFDVDYGKRDSLEGVSNIELNDRHYNLIYGPYLDEYKRPSGIVIVFQDISKEHSLDQMRKDFVANVSHELKTPLTTIKTYTETLMENEMDPPTQDRFLSIIAREIDRMTNIVQDLLILSNIDSSNMKLTPEPILFDSLIRGAIASLEVLRGEKKILVEYKNHNKELIINSDPKALERILTNLISNSYKYTDPEGHVKIEVMDFKDTFRFSVKDNGIGIPYKDQKNIFDRFYRVEKGRSRKEGGTGLGLSITKEYVEKLGGTIILNSKPNLGTEITIIMPKDLKYEK